MKLLVNIGLAREGNTNLGPGTTLRELARQGFTILNHALHHSDTEITVVAEVEPTGAHHASIYTLAMLLQQDCIAVYGYGYGELIGPKAANWGAFNPEFFLTLDGTRLSDQIIVEGE